jgi:dCMP deaminase
MSTNQGRVNGAGPTDGECEISEAVAALQDQDADVTRLTIPVYVDNWDDYFYNLAKAASIKSKDHHCPVGAVIVSSDNVVLSTGFNGLPRKVYDDPSIIENRDEKLKVVLHAEQNAILNAARVGVAVEGATIYVTKFPCLACCNAIAQVGITKIFTLDHEYWKHDPFEPLPEDNHWRKKSVLRQTHIKVMAPNHPDYMTRKPPTATVMPESPQLGTRGR